MAITEAGKRAIAREIAFGIDRVQIAKVRGLTIAGLSEMSRRPEMAAMIEEEREMLSARMNMALVHLNDQVEQSVKNIIAIANNLEHKDSYKANTDILGMFKPPKQESEQKIEINVNADVINTIVGELDKMKDVHAKFNPIGRLMTGDQARVKAFGADPEKRIIDSVLERNSPDE